MKRCFWIFLATFLIFDSVALAAEAPSRWHETTRKLFIMLQWPENFNHYFREIFSNPDESDPLLSQCLSRAVDAKVKELIKWPAQKVYNPWRDYAYAGMANIERYEDQEMADVFFTRTDEIKVDGVPFRYKFSGFFHIHFSPNAKILSCGLYLKLN